MANASKNHLGPGAQSKGTGTGAQTDNPKDIDRREYDPIEP